MKYLKPLKILFLIIAGMTLIPVATNAQQHQGCFLIDENGQHIDLGALCGGSSAPQKPNSLSSPVTLQGLEIPIKRRYAGVPVVDVMFNGQYPFEMLLDTGASGIMINRKMSEVLNIKPHRQILVETAAGIVIQQVGVVDSVQLGSVKVERMEVSISPELSIGLLGQAFFAQYDLTIRDKVIVFTPRF
jgi:predicted aspartyl protease